MTRLEIPVLFEEDQALRRTQISSLIEWISSSKVGDNCIEIKSFNMFWIALFGPFLITKLINHR